MYHFDYLIGFKSRKMSVYSAWKKESLGFFVPQHLVSLIFKPEKSSAFMILALIARFQLSFSRKLFLNDCAVIEYFTWDRWQLIDWHMKFSLYLNFSFEQTCRLAEQWLGFNSIIHIHEDLIWSRKSRHKWFSHNFLGIEMGEMTVSYVGIQADW